MRGGAQLSNKERPPRMPTLDPPSRACPALELLVPTDPSLPYDMHNVLREVFDDGELFELMGPFAPNILTMFARLDGRPVGGALRAALLGGRAASMQSLR